MQMLIIDLLVYSIKLLKYCFMTYNDTRKYDNVIGRYNFKNFFLFFFTLNHKIKWLKIKIIQIKHVHLKLTTIVHYE